jgi:translation initiation factor IF-3
MKSCYSLFVSMGFSRAYYYFRWGCNSINKNNSNLNKNSKNHLAVNNDIREPQVRLVGEDGNPLGIMSGKDAQALADKANLDLVMIAPQGKPPVCKIMDYGKYRFDQSKREKDQRKHQQQAELKEVRLSLNIDDHDFMTKANHAKKFLKQGSKVKVTIRFKGREVTHFDLGRKLMERFKQECLEFGVSDDKPSKLEGRFYTAVIVPKIDKPVMDKSGTAPGKSKKNKTKEEPNEEQNQNPQRSEEAVQADKDGQSEV